MAGGASVRKRMSRLGHSQPGRADSKSSHFRYAPIANKFRSPAKCRDVPAGDMEGGTPSHYSNMPALSQASDIPSL
jgi:hypothetical protein